MKQKLLFLLTALMLLVTGNAWGKDVEITETYDFKTFIGANGTANLTTSGDGIAQSGTSEKKGTVKVINNLVANGQTLNLKGRFAVDYQYNASTQIRWIWRNEGTTNKIGLVGNWNNKGTADPQGAARISVLNLKAGDKITFTYAKGNAAADLKTCSASQLTGVAVDAALVSATEYTVAADGNLDLYITNNNIGIHSIVIVTSGEANTTAFNALKTYADALVDVENDNGAATTTLSNAIAIQNSVVENATSQTQIDNATAALRTAMDEFVSVATPTKGHQFDLTYMLTNPNVEGIVDWGDAAAQGWFTDIPRTDLGTYNNFAARTNLNSSKNAIERYTSDVCTTAGTYALYQKVTLPSGNYLFKSFALANAATTIVMAAGNTEGDAVTTSDFTEYSVNFTQASKSEVKVGTKISSEGTNTCNWTAITGIKLYKTSAPTFTLSDGQAKQVSFHNAGSGNANEDNWMIDLYNNESRIAAVRADWWDDVAGGNANFTNAYICSTDGGYNLGSLNWTTFCNDSKNADAEFTVSYKSGSLYIIGTMKKGSNIYYVNYTKTSLSGVVDVYLYGHNAKLSNISSIDASVKTTTVQPGVIKATIPSSGYGSLASAYGLDFSNVEGLTAFVVSDITNDAVKLKSINEVPENRGVILKGTPGTEYNIPMKSDASYDGTNKLHAAVTAYACAANEVYILQGGQFHLVTAASTVPAGKAYLLAENVPNEARSLIISDEEDPTAISAIEAAESEAGALKDGKYLINGKIIIVKNGVKYSANGQNLN